MYPVPCLFRTWPMNIPLSHVRVYWFRLTKWILEILLLSFQCPHEGCEWAFTTAYKLKRHARGHTGEKPYVVSSDYWFHHYKTCCTVVTQYSTLLLLVHVKTLCVTFIWQCSHEGCGKCFTTAYNLKTHIRAHYRKDTHMCRYEGCDKTFPTAHKLKVHERRHQADRKPYGCEMEGCGKMFSSLGTLTSHLKTHSGEKPHACPVEGCEKRFTKASKLKLHLRSHTGERPFHCEVEVQFIVFPCLGSQLIIKLL